MSLSPPFSHLMVSQTDNHNECVMSVSCLLCAVPYALMEHPWQCHYYPNYSVQRGSKKKTGKVGDLPTDTTTSTKGISPMQFASREGDASPLDYLAFSGDAIDFVVASACNALFLPTLIWWSYAFIIHDSV